MIYGLALLCCVLFDMAYSGWFSGVALVLLLGLPWLSLALSLPGILTFRLGIQGDGLLEMGEEGDAWAVGSSPFPLLPFRGKLLLTSCFTGQSRRYCQEGLPTAHCGGYRVTLEMPRCYDYLGLFSFPVKGREEKILLVRPRPVPVRGLPDLRKFTAKTWRPKFGGGFSENHELRLYRPGDSLNQVHWKLSAKTGKLTVREPMVPQRGLMLLTMDLKGSPEEIDRKFGRLLWLGTYLLRQSLPFSLRVLTGEGIRVFSVAAEPELRKAVDKLLCLPLAREATLRDRAFAASWQYHIGGEPDEGT